MTFTKTIITLALGGLLSTGVFAASDDASKTTHENALPPGGGNKTMTTDPTSPSGGNGADADGSATGIDGKPGSMDKGADSGTTDNGPGTMGGAKGEGSSGDGSGGKK